MRHFPAALLALLLAALTSNGMADAPAGTGDEISDLSPFVVVVDTKNAYVPPSPKETEDKLNAWAQHFLQSLRGADSIEIRDLHYIRNNPEGRLLWSFSGREKLAELAGLVRFEKPTAPVGCGEYWYYPDNLQIKSGPQTLEKCRVIHPFGFRSDSDYYSGCLMLTEESAKLVAEWFRKNGYAEYTRGAYSPGQNRLDSEARLAGFKAFFSKWEQERLFPDIGKCKTPEKVQEKYQSCIRSLLSDSKDRVDLLSRIFMALGRADAYMRLESDRWGMIAKMFAGNVDDAEYVAALNRACFDRQGLLGASESFFRRCMTDVLAEPDRTFWTLRIANARFMDSYTEEKIRMLDLVDKLESPDATTLLALAATGVVEHSFDYRPGFRNFLVTRHACELLAGRGGEVRAALVAGRLSACPENDTAELTRIAFSLALDPKIVNNDILTALAEDEEALLHLTDFLTACRDVEVFQRLVDLMEEDERFVWLETFFDAFEKAVGHTFFIPDKGAYLGDWIRESANRQTVRNWWAANRDRLAAEWAAVPAK
jgi:hypothetical protein